jgi:hypothetical protein
MLAQLVFGPRSGAAEPVPQPVPARVQVRTGSVWFGTGWGTGWDWMGLVEPIQSQERTSEGRRCGHSGAGTFANHKAGVHDGTMYAVTHPPEARPDVRLHAAPTHVVGL